MRNLREGERQQILKIKTKKYKCCHATNLDWDFPAVCFRYVVALLFRIKLKSNKAFLVNKLTKGNLDRVLDRNIMTLLPGIDMTLFVISVSIIG